VKSDVKILVSKATAYSIVKQAQMPRLPIITARRTYSRLLRDGKAAMNRDSLLEVVASAHNFLEGILE